MVNAARAGHDPGREPVLISLTSPVRRGLARGLVCGIGSGAAPEIPRIDAGLPDAELADFLAEAAHVDTGFVAVTDDGDRALAIIAATVAALCGEQIHAALRQPDVAFLAALKPPAVEALRGVLLAVETDSPDRVIAALRVLGAD